MSKIFLIVPKEPSLSGSFHVVSPTDTQARVYAEDSVLALFGVESVSDVTKIFLARLRLPVMVEKFQKLVESDTTVATWVV